MSAPALAEELEVSHRTILRDIDQLSAAGVPVWSERGREGGFRLREGWSTELTGLTEDEAQALFLAGLPAAATELGLGAASASARLKMLAAVPEVMREDALRVGARLHIDPVDWYRAAAPPLHLQVVANAVWRQRVLKVRYESWSGSKDRVLKPLGLVLKAGTWYLVALADAGKQPRTYRLSNINELSVAGSTFRYPGKFNLATFWAAATRRFETEIYSGSASVRMSARGRKRIAEFSAVVAEAVARTAVVDPADPGWTRAILPIESIEHAASQFLGIGVDVEVLEPLALRKRMHEFAKAMHALYGN